MRLEPDQLARFAPLLDEWLDVPVDARSRWLQASQRDHPDLGPALRAMVERGNAHSAADPLSFPGLGGEVATDGDEPLAGELIGPYRLLSLLGRGGMGSVWLAEQVDGRLHRTLAVKLPRPELALGNWRRRFERERDILAALDHPGIAKLFDAGVTAGGQPYLAMQHVDGKPLTRYAQRHGLPIESRVRLFVELLGVVQHAHTALVAHRDLKPGNILVDERGRVMLLDFGIAKLLGEPGPPASDATEFAGPALTLDYASPEQVAGRPVGTGTDVYSLGVVLYELLAGRRPYRLRRTSRASIEEAVLEQELRPPSGQIDPDHARSIGIGPRKLKRQLRGDLDAIVLKALRKKPEDRYLTAQAFADDLDRWLRKQPVTAQPDAFGYRTRRMLARHWRPLAAGVALAAALLGFALEAALQARDAREATELARVKARRAEVVTAFLQDLFLSNGVDQADPEAARKRTAEQLVGDAAARIGDALRDAPDEQIALLHRLAQTSFEMRLQDRARQLARQAADLANRRYGPDDQRAEFEEGYWLQVSAAANRGEVLDAHAPALLRTLPRLAASPRDDDRRLALLLCDALMQRDWQTRAEVALQWAAIAEPLLAQNEMSDNAIYVHHMLGVVDLENLRLADATRHFAATARIQAARGMAVQDAESFPTWRGRLQEVTGHYARAEAMIREGYAMERRNDAGGTHLNDWGMADFARFLVDTGRPADALALLRTGGPLGNDNLRSRLPISFRSIRSQAHALVRLGYVEEATTKAAQAAILIEKAFDESLRPPMTVVMEAALAAGRPEQALALLDREEPRLARGRASEWARSMSEYRIRALVAVGRAGDARAYLEAHRATLAPPGVGAADEARLAWLDGGVALLEGRPDAAQRVLDDGLRTIEQAAPEDRFALHEWRARLQDRIGDADLALGDTVSARSAYAAARTAYEQIVDPAVSMVLGRVVAQLATLARRRGDAPEARRLTAQAEAIVRRHPGQVGWGS